MFRQSAKHLRCRSNAVEDVNAKVTAAEEYVLGITLGELQRFVTEIQEQLRQGWSTADVCEHVVKPITADAKCSYVQLVAARGGRVGTATVFVSHAWRYTFAEFAEAVLTLQCTEERPEEVFVWIDVFSVNQHKSDERDFTWWSTTFKETVRDIGRTLVVLAPFHDPVPLTRAWCLFEIFCTMDTGALLDLRLSSKEEVAFRVQLCNGEYDFNEWVAKVNLERAEAWDPQDRAKIMQAVMESGGVGRLNEVVIGALREWLTAQGRRALYDTAEDDRATPGLILNLANLLIAQGKLDEAALLRREALEGMRVKLSADHLQTLDALINIAALSLETQGKNHGEAEPLFREVLEGRRAKLGADHPDTLDAMYNLAVLLTRLGKLSEAEPLYREALEGRRAKLGADHPATLDVMINLAKLLQTQGKLSEAEPLFREALEGRRAKLGADHPATLGGLSNLACLLKAQGKLGEAEPLFREALEGRRAKLGADHPDTVETMYNFTILLMQQGKLREAEPLCCGALEGWRANLGADHPNTLSAMTYLAYLLQTQGKLSKAEPLYREALEGRRVKLSADHPDTLDVMINLANLLKAQGKLGEAEPLYREALEGRRVKLGADHPDTLGVMINLACLMYSQGKLGEAEPLFREALEGRRAKLGIDHPATLDVMYNLAVLLTQQGKLSEAEPLYREALEGRRFNLGADHPTTLNTMTNLAILLAQQDKLGEAELLCYDALEGKRAKLGADHPDTLFAMNFLASLLQAQGKLSEVEPCERMVVPITAGSKFSTRIEAAVAIYPELVPEDSLSDVACTKDVRSIDHTPAGPPKPFDINYDPMFTQAKSEVSVQGAATIASEVIYAILVQVTSDDTFDVVRRYCGNGGLKAYRKLRARVEPQLSGQSAGAVKMLSKLTIDSTVEPVKQLGFFSDLQSSISRYGGETLDARTVEVMTLALVVASLPESYSQVVADLGQESAPTFGMLISRCEYFHLIVVQQRNTTSHLYQAALAAADIDSHGGSSEELTT
ncbi:hypothetical protein CYMTET_45279 [Cymbomonas tetramitiformis]|uniref:Kinesin light chain n=1 Tax=Cymbomonas tetramitiformis TaxID=36881 RepID=A0AAE0EY66_9CHLO|nr:hypothetical protein CYMTET_45279 [Cymbomonas tetramitiformis]